MIVVRDIFHVQFGKAAQFKAAMLEGKKFFDGAGVQNVRMLSDYVADYYTFVLETSYDSLAAMEASLAIGMKDQAWRDWYHHSIVPLCTSGKREIFTVIAN